MVKIMIVGEAWGRQEEMLKKPFVGSSGQELTRMLAEAGIDRKDCYLTNVFNKRPPNNKIKAFTASKIQVGGRYYRLPPLASGQYFTAEALGCPPEEINDAWNHGELDRLAREIISFDPNIIIALGNVAYWALMMERPAITRTRGTIMECRLVPGVKVLPTFHPSYILRKWDDRAIAVADLTKATVEQHTTSIEIPRREIWIDPDLDDLRQWITRFRTQAKEDPEFRLAVDIETGRKMVKTIGMGDTWAAIVVPFVDFRKPDYSYWSEEDEITAWCLCRDILADVSVKKVLQNGLYDAQYLWRFGMPMFGFGTGDDTMLLHHALQPELRKDLGFLGSVYTNQPSWKGLRPKGETGKREE